MTDPRSFPRAVLGALAVALAVISTAGGVHRLGALTPANVFSLEVVTTALTVHGVGGLFIPLALLLGFVSLTRPPGRAGRRALTWASLIALGVAAAATTMMTLVPAVRAASLWALGGAHLFIGAIAVYEARALSEQPYSSWGLALAGLAEVLAGIGFFAGSFVGSRWPVDLLMAGSLTIVANAESGRPRLSSRLALVVFGTAAFALSLSGAAIVVAVAVVSQLVAATVLGASSWRAVRAGSTHGAWPRRYLALAIATFAQAVLLRAVLSTVSNTHLPDTLFAVGAVHFEFFTPAFALLGFACRGWHRRLDRPERARRALVGFVLLAIGSHVLAWSFVVMGSRGMPRRAYVYLAQFEVLQIVCTCGAMVLFVGLVAASLSLLHAVADEGSPSDPKSVMGRG